MKDENEGTVDSEGTDDDEGMWTACKQQWKKGR